ncbi:bacteriocin-associated integral membrane family protein [Bacillus sp. SW14]|uniref:bacteriocin-associated integral membrane family protein n=1 Tax=Bacillus sp. SW14 TaxID=3391618 RepID=UPI0039E31B98
MRKIVILFLVISSLFSFLISFRETANKQIEEMEQLDSSVGKPFTIPDDPLLNDPKEMIELIMSSSKKYKTNIFRPATNFSTNDKVEISKYVLLTQQTDYFNGIELSQGKFLSKLDTQSKNFYISTQKSKDKNQIGQIEKFGITSEITIKPLKNSFDYLPVNGTYYAEIKGKYSFEDFLKGFVNEINEKFDSTFEINDFLRTREVNDSYAKISTSSLQQYNYLILIVTLFLLIYYIVNESKTIGVLKLHGYSNLRIWFQIVGKLLIFTFCFSLLLSIICTIFLPGSTFSFIMNTIMKQIINYLIIGSLSILTYFYIRKVKVNLAIKNKKDTNSIFIFNSILKIVCSILIIVIGSSTLNQYSEVKKKQSHLDDWKVSKDYGVFNPLYIGHDIEDVNNGKPQLTNDIDNIYPILNKMGALLIDTREYEEEFIRLNSRYKGIRSIIVNDNYLKQFPVYNSEKQPISINEREKRLILLVPEKYKQQREKIIKFFKEDRKESAVAYDEEFLGRYVPKYLKEPKIHIIWTASDQKIFSFNPEVFKAEDNLIIDPIIQVVTENNSLVGDRNTILGNGSRDPLKIKLNDRDSKKTMNILEPYLKKYHLDDNLKYLVSLNQYALNEIKELHSEISSLLALAAVLAVALVLLIVQNSVIYFNKKQQKFVVYRLFGIGFFRTYKDYMTLFFILWLIQFISCIVVKRGITLNLLICIVFLLILELVTSIIALIIIERRNKIKVMKGGF